MYGGVLRNRDNCIWAGIISDGRSVVLGICRCSSDGNGWFVRGTVFRSDAAAGGISVLSARRSGGGYFCSIFPAESEFLGQAASVFAVLVLGGL